MYLYVYTHTYICIYTHTQHTGAAGRDVAAVNPLINEFSCLLLLMCSAGVAARGHDVAAVNLLRALPLHGCHGTPASGFILLFFFSSSSLSLSLYVYIYIMLIWVDRLGRSIYN